MREIKFRAWDKRQRKMIGGCCNLLMGMDGCLFWNFGRSCNVLGGQKFTDYILMQYTGLKNKNGKEICEGDILKDKYGVHILYSLQEYIRKRHNWLEDDNYEIIGNIYENPELLKED